MLIALPYSTTASRRLYERVGIGVTLYRIKNDRQAQRLLWPLGAVRPPADWRRALAVSRQDLRLTSLASKAI
jgi:hypothetical protein